MKRFLITACVLLVLSCTEKGFLPKSDKEVLFAPPAQSEIDRISADWQKRNLRPTNYQIVQEADVLNGKFTLKIVAYTVSGIKEYGALLIPKTGTQLPVRMQINGFGLGITTNSVALVGDNSSFSPSFILAIPALRGQSLALTLNGTLYSSPISEGEQCDAFDGATDDTIAFLNLIEQTEKSADVNRTSVRGGSRGGTVSLLAGIRDKRVKRVVGVVCPTDLIGLTAKMENDKTYQCQFLNAVKSNPSALQSVRDKLIQSSPFYFASQLPLTQLHMGQNDPIVPIGQGNKMQERIAELGMKSNFDLYTYNRAHTDIVADNQELINRIEQFLSAL